MITDEIIKNIENFFADHKSYVSRVKFLKDNYSGIFLQVSKGKVIENLFKLLYGVVEEPTCLTCKKPVKFDTFCTGYKEFCSHECAVSNDRTVMRRKKTNLEKYGFTNPLGSPVIREKRKETMLEKYGTEFPLQCKELKNKVGEKNKSRSSEEWDIISRKRRDTILDQYGVENLWELPEFVNKINQTNLKIRGVEWPQQSEEVKKKGRKTRRNNFLRKLDLRCIGYTPLFNKFIGINDSNNKPILYKWECNACNKVFEDHIDDGSFPTCPICYPKEANSSGEAELINFLEKFDIEIRLHEKSIVSPKEIDIFLPKFSVAIEYCGLYWHSEKKIHDYKYHQNKWKQCKENGIRLITIFEDEWKLKRGICEARIKHILGLSDKICSARQCVVREIFSSEYSSFLNNTHIQGSVKSKYKLGAFYNDKLVAVMGFGPARVALGFKNSNLFELLRFSTTGNIPGIGSKLFKSFVKTYSPPEIISYCDLRWGTGIFYKKLGFAFNGITPPNYWYTKDGVRRVHRYKFTKHKLREKYGFSDKTEREIMQELGYYRIYDCGNYKFIWKK